MRAPDPEAGKGRLTASSPLTAEALYQALRRTLLLAAGLFLAYRLAGPISAILLLFLLVFILTAVINPLAAWLQARGIPRMVTAIGVVLLAIGAVVLLGWLAIPPLLSEVGQVLERFDLEEVQLGAYYQDFLNRYPGLAEELPPASELLQRFSPNLGVILGRLGLYTLNLFTGVLSLLILLVLVLYSVADPDPLVTGFLSAVPPRFRQPAHAALARSMEQLKNWALGSAVVGLIVGVVVGVGLHLLGLPYAFLFGVLAAVGELVPTIGPIITAVPPLLLALTINPWLGLWVLLLFVAIQQVEGNVLTPLILGRSLHLHPVSIIFTLLVMHSLFGLLGALLAVPVCAILKVCWEELYLKPNRADVQELEAEASEITNGGSTEEAGRQSGQQAG